MEKEVKKYRIETTRLQNWNYSDFGFYFITICTKNMQCFLSDIINEKLSLSSAGSIVKEEWFKTEQIRDSVTLDEFIIMPNHFHGIIIIDNDEKELKESNRLPDTLGTIVNQFKGACTKRIRNELKIKNFSWQSRYYDRIIRTEVELYNTRNYIKYNYLKWHEDEYYKP